MSGWLLAATLALGDPLAPMLRQCARAKEAGDDLKTAQLSYQLALRREQEGSTFQACRHYATCAQLGFRVGNGPLVESCIPGWERCTRPDAPEQEGRDFYVRYEVFISQYAATIRHDPYAAVQALGRAREHCAAWDDHWQGCGQLLGTELDLALQLGLEDHLVELLSAIDNIPPPPPWSGGTRRRDRCEKSDDKQAIGLKEYRSNLVYGAFKCIELGVLGRPRCAHDIKDWLWRAQAYLQPLPKERWEHQNILVNLAWAHLLERELLAASKALAGLEKQIEDEPELKLWYLGARLRLAQQSQERDWGQELTRLRSFLREPRRSAAMRWLGALWVAEALAAAGQRAAAIDELYVAEDAIDEHTLSLALGGQREDMYGYFDASTRILLDLLVDEGRPYDVADLIQRVRRRATLPLLELVTSPQWGTMLARGQRAEGIAGPGRLAQEKPVESSELVRELLDKFAGTLTVDRCGPPEALPPGRIQLGFAMGNSGWIGVVATREGTRVVRLALGRDALAERFTDKDLGRRLLGPFATELNAATTVEIVQIGETTPIRVDALPWGRSRLHVEKQVVYPVPSPVPPARPEIRGWAFVGAYLGSGLKNEEVAVRVLDDMVPSLASNGWDTEMLDDSRLGRDGLIMALERAQLGMLFVHGKSYSDMLLPGDPWNYGLMLAGAGGDERLGVPDLLTIAHVPEFLILGACGSAGDGGHAPSASGRMAQIAVLKGAEFVVATTAAVNACVTEQLMSAVAAELASDPTPAEFLEVFSRVRQGLWDTSREQYGKCVQTADEYRYELSKFSVFRREEPW